VRRRIFAAPGTQRAREKVNAGCVPSRGRPAKMLKIRMYFAGVIKKPAGAAQSIQVCCAKFVQAA
jgi:hypothetical protein